jgi:hypothetical protein
MNTGLVLALVSVGVSGAFALWIARTRQPVPARGLVVGLMLAFGICLGAFGWWSSERLRRETLFEVVAEGTLGLAVGDPAPERRFVFDVVHARTEHTLSVWPEIPGPSVRYARGEVTVGVRVLDPDGATLVADERVHAAHSRSLQWRSERYSFRPDRSGPHTLVLVMRTAEIPALHARIVDPMGVAHGRRPAGF